MKLVTTEGSEDFARGAARFVENRVRETPAISLTLPTGRTPLGLYELLRDAHRERRFSLDQATVFMLDEYCDLPAYPADSFIEYLDRSLGDVIFNDSTTVRVLSPSRDPKEYDDALDLAGGLDLAIVGVGRNGHVGFNEPGDDPIARTHVVTLAPGTIAANFRGADERRRPTRAITIGLADLRRARSILMLVAGEHKRGTAELLAAGIVDPLVPATLLLEHDDLTMMMEGQLLRGR